MGNLRSEQPLHIVTGAFGFSGRHIAERLLRNGVRIRTLTNHPDDSSPLRRCLEVAPLDFTQPSLLVESMRGAAVLYNTYWVRFAHASVDHESAVENTRLLIRAAEKAGVQRIVHISITNPSTTSPLSYFHGKAAVEELIRQSTLSYAILRPAVLFGDGGILINNIAWLLRRFPFFAVPGNGDCSLQPIFVEDLAALAVERGASREDCVLDAVGPETYRYEDLVRLISDTIGSRSRIVHLPPSLVTLASRVLSHLVHDVVLTREEVSGLMANLLVSKQPPTGKTSLRAWLQNHAQTIGLKYSSELDRHYI